MRQSTIFPALMTPPRALAAAVAVAVLLAALPPSWLAPVQGWALALLCPGQRAAVAVVDFGHRLNNRLVSHFGNAAELAAARREAERLADANRLLTRRLEALRSRIADADAERPEADRALLRLGGIEARVLGQQARGYLARQKLLDMGSLHGVEPGALVLDGAAILDRGGEHGVQPGYLVLDTGRVWGRVIRTGPNTAVVRIVTAAGFRDVVRLRSSRGPEGILEGTGQPLCRIRMIATTEPAAPGDDVFAASLAGLDAPAPHYGVIERVEQAVGAAHWDIWMRPAAGSSQQRVVIVSVRP